MFETYLQRSTRGHWLIQSLEMKLSKSKSSKTSKKLVIEIFVAIFLGMLQRGEAVTESSVTIPSSDANTTNPVPKETLVMAANDQNKKELIDRVKDLELQFQQHVSESKAERGDQYEKISIIEAAKKAQGAKLKLVLDKIEVLKVQNRDQTARIEELEDILKTKTATSSVHSVINPNNEGSTIPSSCEDLKSSGHRLNGIYMVFDADVKEMLATYCHFRQSSPIRTESRVIGSLSTNTLIGGVYFYAQMKKTFKEVGKIVPFDRILVNQGNGLSSTNKGVFIAPRPGIYHFTFKGHNYSGALGLLNPKILIIEIHHNGIIVGDAAAAPTGLLHVHATLKLKAGDRIYIFKSSAGDLFTDIDSKHPFQWLAYGGRCLGNLI